MFTTTFEKTINAYLDGYRIIINKGGSRSGKTFAELQLLELIANKKKAKVITTVSHSHPHLVGGAIRDYDAILLAKGISPDAIRTKNPYVYKHKNSIHEFVGFDTPGKALGAARDILFINEANKMNWSTCHQLIQRTRETIFLDYNPSNSFWVDSEGLSTRSDAIVITSTYIDNYNNLTDGQIADFLEAKQKAKAEKLKGIYGYWSNWWSVYGKGIQGQVEGAIFNNWATGEFDITLPFGYGLDFGSRDPDAMVMVAIDVPRKKIYCKEIIYKSGNSSEQLISLVKSNYIHGKLIVADSAGARSIDDLKGNGVNIIAVSKTTIIEGIKQLQSFEIIVTPESTNLINELTSYVWLEKKGEIPSDTNNHLIDALRYYVCTIIKPNYKRSNPKMIC
jgi:phage terminase large subunit